MIVKVLSIRQPWAWTIIHAGKDIENRSWPTSYRGPLYIHASRQFDHDGYLYLLRQGITPPFKGHTYEGGIIGRCELVDCVTESKSAWFAGEYGFVLKNPVEIKFRPCLGRLGIFEIDLIEQ